MGRWMKMMIAQALKRAGLGAAPTPVRTMSAPIVNVVFEATVSLPVSMSLALRGCTAIWREETASTSVRGSAVRRRRSAFKALVALLTAE